MNGDSLHPAVFQDAHHLQSVDAFASQPMRIFAVTGTLTALATSLATSARTGQSRSNDEPPFFDTTLFTGQPKLISMKSGCFQSTILRAASPMRLPSAPNNCTPTGRCTSSNSV